MGWTRTLSSGASGDWPARNLHMADPAQDSTDELTRTEAVSEPFVHGPYYSLPSRYRR